MSKKQSHTIFQQKKGRYRCTATLSILQDTHRPIGDSGQQCERRGNEVNVYSNVAGNESRTPCDGQEKDKTPKRTNQKIKIITHRAKFKVNSMLSSRNATFFSPVSERLLGSNVAMKGGRSNRLLCTAAAAVMMV